MEAIAKAKNIRMSARKMRLVIDQIRGQDVNEAYAILQFSKKKASLAIDKVLRSAVANATYKADEAGESLDVDELFVARRTSTKAERSGDGVPEPTDALHRYSSEAVT